MFLKEVSWSPGLKLLDKIMILEFSWIFSIITPVFSVTWSFRNHCKMLICC